MLWIRRLNIVKMSIFPNFPRGLVYFLSISNKCGKNKARQGKRKSAEGYGNFILRDQK
jgi:hypothetical protein